MENEQTEEEELAQTDAEMDVQIDEENEEISLQEYLKDLADSEEEDDNDPNTSSDVKNHRSD